jgi:hypothetical protein
VGTVVRVNAAKFELDDPVYPGPAELWDFDAEWLSRMAGSRQPLQANYRKSEFFRGEMMDYEGTTDIEKAFGLDEFEGSKREPKKRRWYSGISWKRSTADRSDGSSIY